MRKRFELQMKLGQVPIEKLVIPTNSRDELPPVMRGLQWIFQTPEVKEQIFRLLEKKVKGRKKATGRPGMDLWHILVLGVVRLALNCDYDRLEDLVRYHKLLRQMMGLDTIFEGEFGEGFHQRTLRDNVCHVDEALLQEINAIVAKAGMALFKKKGDEPIQAKSDTYVLEADVHFPTDLNLLCDASRKCIGWMRRHAESLGLSGWRKSKVWERQMKTLLVVCGRVSHGGGAHKEARFKEAVRQYLGKGYALEQKVFESLAEIEKKGKTFCDEKGFRGVVYFHEMLMKHLDLIERRVFKGEQIPHGEKLFSLFEPHTEWINKGKAGGKVELGHKLLVTTGQRSLVLDYAVLEKRSDAQEAVPLADRLLSRLGAGSIGSLSFDKGFSSEGDRELLGLYIPEVIMPKKGRRLVADREREGGESFRRLRFAHAAIESDINCLEHHGLNRCLDLGLEGFKRYVGFGILAYNLHKIGDVLLMKQAREKWAKERLLKKAA